MAPNVPSQRRMVNTVWTHSLEAADLILRWFTHNFANTATPTHADLGSVEFSASIPESIKRIEHVVARLARWRVVESGRADIHLTRTTRVFRFVDDVRLTLTPTPTGCLVHFESKSRVGVGDLGQNRRNILELQQALRKAL